MSDWSNRTNLEEDGGDSSDPGDVAYVERNFPVRLMNERDLPRLIEIDAKAKGFARREYFEEKFDACIREPGINISLIAEVDGNPVGFLLGLLFLGEFGVPSTRAVLHTLGVHPNFEHQGVAHALLRQFQRNLQALRIDSIHTLVEWDQFQLLQFFKSIGFRPGRERDLIWDTKRFPFSGHHADVEIRPGTAADVEQVAAIDAEVLNSRRRRYFENKLQTSINRPDRYLFLVAQAQGEVAGFLVSGLYRGEFGIETARGVIDSFGVRQKHRHHGIASALLEGLLVWLNKNKVDQIETLCRWNDWELLQFFEYVGFRPSARLNLEWQFS